MKKILRFMTAGILLGALMPLAASAAQFKADHEVSLSSGENVTGNLYLAGGNVSAAAAVRGDLAAAGGSLLISGPVSNDLLAAGGNITVLSDVGGDVRIGGGNVLVQGAVAGDVLVGGGQVNLTGSRIGGDVAVGGGSVVLSAPVVGNVKIGGGQVTINSSITGNVQVMADKVSLGPKAVINGNFTYTASEEASMQTGAVVRGKVEFTKRENVPAKNASQVAIAFTSLALAVKFLMSLVGALILLWILPRFAQELATSFATKSLENLGRGFVALVVIPAASLILMITVVGLPLGILGLLGYIALLIFVSLAAPIATGTIVHKWIWKPAGYEVNWKTVLLGAAIYFLLGLIPFIGWIVKFCIMLITLGVVVQIKWAVVKNWR